MRVSFPPRHVCIVGALWVAMGAMAVPRSVGWMMGGRVTIDLSFVLFFLGRALLNGNPTARVWTLVLAGVGVAGGAAAAGFAAWSLWKHAGGLPLTTEDAGSAVELMLGTLWCVYMLHAMMRKDQRAWFGEMDGERAEVMSLTWAAAMAGVMLGSAPSVAEWRVREMYEKPLPFHVKVVPYDAASGRGLERLSYGDGDVSTPRGGTLPKPTVRCSIYLGPEGGRYLLLEGEAAQPFGLTVHAAGYTDKVISVCAGAEYEIRVPLQRLGADDGGGKKPGASAAEPEVKP